MKFQPKAIVECWVNMNTRDVKMIWHGDPLVKQLAEAGYKKHDQKEVFFRSIEVPNG